MKKQQRRTPVPKSLTLEKDRIIASVEFKTDQHAAVLRCAQEDGHPFSSWLLALALREAKTRGYWDPFKTVEKP